jgi:hypothetical protein
MKVTYMKNVVPIKSIPGNLFSWCDGEGTIEESTLQAEGYDDFTDRFVIKSGKTGNFMTFYLEEEMTDEDEEIFGWLYKSETGVEVTILND